jgi:hypothetical protein
MGYRVVIVPLRSQACALVVEYCRVEAAQGDGLYVVTIPNYDAPLFLEKTTACLWSFKSQSF